MSRPKGYQTEAERVRNVSNNLGERPAYNTTASYPSAAYPNAYPAQSAGSQYPPAPYANPSPNMRPAESPQVPYASSAYGNPTGTYYASGASIARPASTTPYGGGQVYPPGHTMEGRPIPRSTTPIPGGGAVPAGLGMAYSAGQAPFPQMPDPNAGDQGQLPAPEGFSRPINAAQAYTPFEPMKIQDMDDLILNAPRMPAVLQPHDVYQSDWNRLMQDLCLAWTGRLPAPGRPQKKHILAADLIDLWNVSFFFPRGVEVVLYKGRERRSGPNAGAIDIQLPTYDDHEDASSSSSSSSEDSDSDSGGRYPAATYMYGQQPFAPGQGSMAEVLDQRRRRREMRAEKKRRRKEKKARRKAKAREKKYALYLTCVPNGAGAISGGVQTMGAPGMSGASGGHGIGGMPNPMSGAGYGAGMGGMGMPMGGAGYGAVAGGMPMSNQSGGY